MEFFVFSVRDCLLGMYGNLLMYRSENQAVRDFDAAMSSDEVASIAHQYDLYKVGSFDAKCGRFKAIEPELVRLGSQVVQTQIGDDIVDDEEISL